MKRRPRGSRIIAAPESAPGVYGRPCKYCVAEVEGFLAMHGSPKDFIKADATDCEFKHRDEQRVYDLATAFARALQDRHPTDEQISWFLEDANEVVDDFDPTPERWRVRRLPESANDGPDGIEVRLRINDVTFVALEGGKDCRGSVLPLKKFRQQMREAN